MNAAQHPTTDVPLNLGRTRPARCYVRPGEDESKLTSVMKACGGNRMKGFAGF